MTQELLRHIQAMYNSGQITQFISAAIPLENLGPGWLEHSLLSKGFHGKMQDKQNQEELIIPTDRFARLLVDTNKSDDLDFALLILGVRGLTKSKLYSLIYRLQDKTADSWTGVTFWTKDITLADAGSTLVKYILNDEYFIEDSEPDLDYIEQLRVDSVSDMIHNLLVLKIPTGKKNMADWIRLAIDSKEQSKDVIVKSGDVRKLSIIAILLSRWITNLEYFKKNKDNLAAILLMFHDRLELCFWDSPQRIATFATMNKGEFNHVLDRYLTPMWSDINDLDYKKEKFPEVVLGSSSKAPILERTQRISSDEKELSLLFELKEKIESMEKQLQSFENSSDSPSRNHSQSLSILQARISEIVNRLEKLTTQLSDLEKRLSAIDKAPR